MEARSCAARGAVGPGGGVLRSQPELADSVDGADMAVECPRRMACRAGSALLYRRPGAADPRPQPGGGLARDRYPCAGTAGRAARCDTADTWRPGHPGFRSSENDRYVSDRE